jgi:hypothetical protein
VATIPGGFVLAELWTDAMNFRCRKVAYSWAGSAGRSKVTVPPSRASTVEPFASVASAVYHS